MREAGLEQRVQEGLVVRGPRVRALPRRHFQGRAVGIPGRGRELLLVLAPEG